MVGPNKDYASSEASAYAWIMDHLASPKSTTPQSPFTTEDDLFSGFQHVPLFDSGHGRIVEPPMFKLPPPAVTSEQQAFALTWGEEEQAAPTALPSLSTHAHDDTTSEDDDPELALSDFKYQFTKWTTANAPIEVEDKDPHPGKKEILMYENTPDGHRTAVNIALKNGYIQANNNEQLVKLMHMLANTTNTKIKDDSTEIERSVSAGGAVLGEITEDGELQPPSQRHVEPVKHGRLKGKARMEAKKAGKK
ncbi:hypothetical protein CC86DRAFT_28784 [Ophiobolus disseminans]|uniref:Uncharacterized protein n=1 Tax=Ophiobolus disseminans TaxID=1469910 RepID=A0A6A6ZZA1_9PLEO|nr:hypothetical protein CC86DRAFT_28784 [Ophiobolus disseminans]